MRKRETRQRITNRAVYLREKTFKNRVKPIGLGDWSQGNDQWYEIYYWYVGFKPRVIKEKKHGRTEYYYVMDHEFVMHRENGPAVIFDNGHKQWWLYGKPLDPEDFDSIAMVKRMNAWTYLTPVQIATLCEKEKDKS